MKAMPLTRLSVLAAALAAALAGQPAALAADDDAAKLKELEHALAAPAEGARSGSAPQVKRRTRAIVFDNEEPPAPAADRAAATPVAAAPARAAGPVDCASLPADVKAVAVDFAIQFKVNSATISPASEPVLEQIAKILALSPERCVLVEGHTDATGNPDKNLALSRDRAGSVVDFISEHNGIDRKRLLPVGKGAGDPLKNLDPRDPKNRRVVFKVVAG